MKWALGDRQKSFYQWKAYSRKDILENELGLVDSDSPSALEPRRIPCVVIRVYNRDSLKLSWTWLGWTVVSLEQRL